MQNLLQIDNRVFQTKKQIKEHFAIVGIALVWHRGSERKRFGLHLLCNLCNTPLLLFQKCDSKRVCVLRSGRHTLNQLL